MQKILFNDSWRFAFESDLPHFNDFGFEKYMDASGAPARFYTDSNWKTVDLPHDWAVGLKKDLDANTFAGARPVSHFHRYMTQRRSNAEKVYNIGWYRKEFTLPDEWADKRVIIEFEGAFRDAYIWVNGTLMDRHLSGYTSFAIDATDHLLMGEINSVAVRLDADQPEGWWYEGAGLYRNVYLCACENVRALERKTVVKTDLDGNVSVQCEIRNDTDAPYEGNVLFEIRDRENTALCILQKEISIPPYASQKAEAQMNIASPSLWHVDSPYLYSLLITVDKDTQTTPFGVREVAFDAEKGFLLNRKPLKIRGACVHQDFGGVGVALTDNLQRYKIQKLKEMGVNAYRASHNAPAPALLKACDELGMLVMDETRLFGTSPEAVRQLTDVIERDRNHPSVFIWSLGNEEFSVQNHPISKSLMEKMTRIVKAMDDTRPVTYSGNNGPDFTGANAASEVRGVNYIRNDGGEGGEWLLRYHENHPSQPIIGTEEASYVLSRAGAFTDFGSGELDATGLVTMPWGSTPKGWVKYFEERDYLAGSFMWTGFDYRGEPNPFIKANVSTSFGTIDLCGMEKPPFYYYKAWWTDEPVLKIAPHWNYREGETAEISVFTNLDEITLFVNDRKIETRTVEKFDAPRFSVPFEKGVLRVTGTKDGKTYTDEMITSGNTESVSVENVLPAEKNTEIAVFEISAQDKCGIFNPLGYEKIDLFAENGTIVGVGNGDPKSLDQEQFEDAEAAVSIRTFLDGKYLYTVPPVTQNHLRGRFDWMDCETDMRGFSDDERRVARFSDTAQGEKTTTLKTRISNVSGYEYIEFERLGGKTQVYLNGELIGDNITYAGRIPVSGVRPYRFHANFREGENEITVVSRTTEISDPPISGKVKIAKRVPAKWSVRLHFGKARVFVKPKGDSPVTLKAEISRK